WCQVKADVTGRTVTAVRNAGSTAIGAAMLAGVAEGIFASLDEAAGALIEFGSAYEPRPEVAVIYQAAYERYRRLYSTLEPLFD
ncbi:MAG: xylulokinase, partial [Acidobacteria bacterium]|nr:xylulokinase [Acidobacteriota bacterium]